MRRFRANVADRLHRPRWIWKCARPCWSLGVLAFCFIFSPTSWSDWNWNLSVTLLSRVIQFTDLTVPEPRTTLDLLEVGLYPRGYFRANTNRCLKDALKPPFLSETRAFLIIGMPSDFSPNDSFNSRKSEFKIWLRKPSKTTGHLKQGDSTLKLEKQASYVGFHLQFSWTSYIQLRNFIRTGGYKFVSLGQFIYFPFNIQIHPTAFEPQVRSTFAHAITICKPLYKRKTN